jgi:hypothetical protein
VGAMRAGITLKGRVQRGLFDLENYAFGLAASGAVECPQVVARLRRLDASQFEVLTAARACRRQQQRWVPQHGSDSVISDFMLVAAYARNEVPATTRCISMNT